MSIEERVLLTRLKKQSNLSIRYGLILMVLAIPAYMGMAYFHNEKSMRLERMFEKEQEARGRVNLKTEVERMSFESLTENEKEYLELFDLLGKRTGQSIFLWVWWMGAILLSTGLMLRREIIRSQR